jgi:quinoprotein relay system zinc metallohydrolase 2
VKRFTWILTLLVNVLATPGGAETTRPANVVQIAPGIFIAEGAVAVANGENLGAISNCAFIVGDAAVAVIDTGGSFASGVSLKAAVQAHTSLPIRYVINTHMHPDHVLGNAAFRAEGTVFVGHAKLPRALAARAQQYMQANRALIGETGFAGTEIVLPTLLVDSEATLDLGSRLLRLTAHPTAHTDNDLTVFDEKTGTLFLGDLLFKNHLPAIDGSLNGWLAVLDDLVKLPAAGAVPGHGPASLPWPQGAEAERAYLSALRSNLRSAVKAGWPLARAMESIPAEGGEPWRLIEDFHKRNISAAFGEMEWE